MARPRTRRQARDEAPAGNAGVEGETVGNEGELILSMLELIIEFSKYN